MWSTRWLPPFQNKHELHIRPYLERKKKERIQRPILQIQICFERRTTKKRKPKKICKNAFPRFEHQQLQNARKINVLFSGNEKKSTILCTQTHTMLLFGRSFIFSFYSIFCVCCLMHRFTYIIRNTFKQIHNTFRRICTYNPLFAPSMNTSYNRVKLYYM